MGRPKGTPSEKSPPASTMLLPVGPQQGGQSLVEFALTIGAFLLVLLGALSTALYAVQRSAAVTAAAAGVRAAASARPDSPLGAIPPGRLQVCATLDPSDPAMVLVVVRGRPRPLLPLVPLPWTIDAPAEIHRVTFTR